MQLVSGFLVPSARGRLVSGFLILSALSRPASRCLAPSVEGRLVSRFLVPSAHGILDTEFLTSPFCTRRTCHWIPVPSAQGRLVTGFLVTGLFSKDRLNTRIHRQRLDKSQKIDPFFQGRLVSFLLTNILTPSSYSCHLFS